eukprot:COSAG05_NODE_182_length_14772_cov_42.430655_20_plen_193_part_00
MYLCVRGGWGGRLAERDASSGKLVSLRVLSDVFAVVRSQDDPQWLSIQYEDGTIRAFMSPQREALAACLVDAVKCARTCVAAEAAAALVEQLGGVGGSGKASARGAAAAAGGERGVAAATAAGEGGGGRRVRGGRARGNDGCARHRRRRQPADLRPRLRLRRGGGVWFPEHAHAGTPSPRALPPYLSWMPLI